MSPKELVSSYVKAVWVDKDVDAIDRFLAAGLIQHNATLPNGREAIRAFLPKLFSELMPGLEFRVKRVIVDDDLVAVHAHVALPGKPGMAVVDIYRVADGLIAEHWDVVHEISEETASGNTVF